MKKTILLIIIFFIFSTSAYAANYATNWEINLFGVNPKIITKENWKGFITGVIVSVIVHTGGHYLYAATNDMDVHQEGVYEVVEGKIGKRKYREFLLSGFVAQHAVGTFLVSVPAIKNSGFVKGYVSASLIETIGNPFVFGRDSEISGAEHIGFSALAIFNCIRINWEEDK